MEGHQFSPNRASNKERQHLDLQHTYPSSPQPEKIDVSVVKAAFAFHNAVDNSRHKRESQLSATTTAPSLPTPTLDTPEQQAIHNHEARHLVRIRVARGIQHLITSLLSLMIAVFQGRTYILYQQTKSTPNAWPVHADVFPTLLLFTVAVVALAFDVSAITAYMFPDTKIGHQALKAALAAHNIITTLKGVSYFLTVIVCREGFSQGITSGQNNDLWGWCCSMQGSTMEHVNQAMSVCTTNTIAWIMGIANVVIEALGVAIDFFVKRDARKKAEGTFGAGWEMETAPYSDKNPLLTSGAKAGSYQKIGDDQLEQLDEYGNEIAGGLKDQQEKK